MKHYSDANHIYFVSYVICHMSYSSSFICVSQIKVKVNPGAALKISSLPLLVGFESLFSHKRDWFNQSAFPKHFPEFLKLYNTCRDLSKCVEK